MEALRQDILYALRWLGRSRGFAIVAVLTLAIGIGGTTAIFSVVHAVVLRPLPFPEPERLVALAQVSEGEPTTMSAPNFHDLRDQSQTLESAAVYRPQNLILTGRGEPARLNAAEVTASFFDVLRVRPALGRAFRADENTPGKHTVAVLGHALWRQRFESSRDVVTQSIVLDGVPYSVIGVMPEGFAFPSEREIWVPYARRDMYADANRGAWFLRGIARLGARVRLDEVKAELTTIARRLEQRHPDSNTGIGLTAIPLHERLVGNVRKALLLLMGAVTFVLLITCTNLANLLLARAAGRESEMAVRSALGAARHRLVRQLLTESVVIGAVGGGAGVLVAMWALESLLALQPAGIQRLETVRLDAPVLVFAAGISMLTGVLFGILPALQATRASLATSLKEGARGSAPAGRRMRGALVVAEVALAVTLLAGAGLLIKSFLRLQAVDPGFDPEQTLAFDVDLPDTRYPDAARQIRFYDALVERLASLPGARRTGAVIFLPLRGSSFSLSFDVEGRPKPQPGQEPSMQVRVATPGFFQTLGIPLLRGRLFTPQDTMGRPQVALLSETAVRKFFPNEDPLGRKIVTGWRRGDDQPKVGGEVVGIVGDVKQLGLDAEEPEMYVPYAQAPVGSMDVVVRTSVPPMSLADAVRRELRALDPDLPLPALRTVEGIVAGSISQPRFYMVLVGLFAAVALLLAAVGIFGVMSYSVAQRTRELGIRIALGAEAGSLRRLVVGHAMTLVLAGLGIGLAGALLVSTMIEKMLFSLSAKDPATFASVAALLVAVALVASWLPARRAARVDPVVALRAE